MFLNRARRAWHVWDQFWFGPVDARIAAIVRILFGLCLFGYLARTLTAIDNLYSDVGVIALDAKGIAWGKRWLLLYQWALEGSARWLDPLWTLLATGYLTLVASSRRVRSPRTDALHSILEVSLAVTGWFALFARLSDPARIQILFLLAVVGAGMIVFGFQTRAWLTFVFLTLSWMRQRSDLTFASFDTLYTAMAFFLIFPAGDQRWSVRALWNQSLPATVPIWGLRMLQCQLTVVYLDAAWEKFGIPGWREGLFMSYVLMGDLSRVQTLEWGTNNALFLFSALFTWWALALESFLPVLLWIPASKRLAMFLGVMLHLGISALTRVPFYTPIMITYYACFLNRDDLDLIRKSIAGWISAAGRPLAFMNRFSVRKWTLNPVGKMLVGMVAVAALSVLPFDQGASHGFCFFDDRLHLERNEYLNPPTASNMLNLSSPYFGEWTPTVYLAWRALFPLAIIDTDANGWLSLDPLPFHALNLGLHALNSALVFALFRALGVNFIACLLGAMLFAWHPLQVESVTWISEARGLLAASCSLIAWLLHLAASRKRLVIALFIESLAFFFFALALFSKPSAAAVPLMAAIVDIVWLRRPRINLMNFIPWLAIILFMALRVSPLQQENIPQEARSIPNRLSIAEDSITWWLNKVFLPEGLAMDYGRTPSVALASKRTLWAFAIPWLLFLGRRKRWLMTSVLLFVAGLSPSLGLVPFGHQAISTVADRYAYLAMIGPALAIAAWSRRRPMIVLAPIVAVLIGMGAGSWMEVDRRRDDASIAFHARAVNPNSVDAALIEADLARRLGRNDKALLALKRAHDAHPESGAASAAYLAQALEHRPLEELELQLQRHRERFGDFLIAHPYALALERAGLRTKALAQWKELVTKLRNEPGDRSILSAYARCLGRGGHWDEAEAMLKVIATRWAHSTPAQRELAADWNVLADEARQRQDLARADRYQSVAQSITPH